MDGINDLDDYYDFEEDTNTETNKIKGYKAKKDFYIKELSFQDEDDKNMIIKKLELLKSEITIYEVIERKNNLYIVIDFNKNSSLKFNHFMTKSNNQEFKEESIIRGSGK